MIGLARHLRARRVPTALLIAAACVWGVWAAWTALDVGAIPASMTMAAAGFASVAVGVTLAGADEELERTAALRWRPRRTVHLLLAAGAVVGLLLSVAGSHHAYGESALVLRSTSGSLGLIGLGTMLLGPARAWFPLVPWITIPPLLPARFATGGNVVEQVLTWTVRPPGCTAAAMTAGALALVGAAAYIQRGSRPVPSAQATVQD